MIHRLLVLVFAVCILPLLAADTPKEVVGFIGSITGTVKTVQADGLAFTITIATAVPDADRSTVKDGAPMAGKTIQLGVRTPKKDGKPYNHPDDIAYIKSLKVGDQIAVKIFAVKADPTVLRIQGPGQAETQPATQGK